MLIKHEREKLINAVLFFAANVDKCGKIKLFKLMYFLDFEHYKITGRSVTSMKYFAWKMGPVPVELDEEIEMPEPDMADAVSFDLIPVYQGRSQMLRINSKQQFNDQHFSKRELQIMNDLSRKYKSTNAEDMVEATHLENLPWDVIYNKQGKHWSLIPYELAYQSQEFNEMARVTQEHCEVIEAFG